MSGLRITHLFLSRSRIARFGSADFVAARRGKGVSAPSSSTWRARDYRRPRLGTLAPCAYAAVACCPAQWTGWPASLDDLRCFTIWPLRCWYSVEPADVIARWSPGKYRIRLLLGGRLPIGEHVINLQRTLQDTEASEAKLVVWHDAGYSDLIKVWDHQIVLVDFLGMTRYADEVQIHAGLLTVPTWLFALAFYGHRQRRLNRLVAAGCAY
jgi:hypothetical protein